MLQTAVELETLIKLHYDDLHALKEDVIIYKSSPAKWSKKEIMGHLIDSAQSNIRRFIVAQYEDQPYIRYNQDKWVELSGYQQYNYPDLIDLWQLLNKHIAVILKRMTPEMAQRSCQTENVYTVEYLAIDYIRHLKHHLHQVLDLEPVAYP